MYSACRTSCSKKGIFNKKATHEASFFPFSRLQNVSFPKVSSQYILEKQINRKFYQESEKNELRPFFTTMHFFAASDDLLGQFGNQGCKKNQFFVLLFLSLLTQFPRISDGDVMTNVTVLSKFFECGTLHLQQL